MLGLGGGLSQVASSSDWFIEGGYSVAFDGGGYIDMNSTFQTVFRGSWTMSWWINFDDATTATGTRGSKMTGQQTDDGNNLWHAGIDSSGNWNFVAKMDGQSLNTISADTGFSGNSATGWIHVAVSMINAGGGGAATMEMYINGSSIGTSSAGGMTSAHQDNYTQDSNLFLASFSINNYEEDEMKGKMYDVAMWDVALSDATVAAIYNSGSPFNLTGNSGSYNNSGDLVGYWRFQEGTGLLVADSSTNNNTITFQYGGAQTGIPQWDLSTP